MPTTEIHIRFFGHTCLEIKMEEKIFFLDPYFSQNHETDPLHSKLSPPLPNPRALLVSQLGHKHWDLLSFKYFKTHCPLLLPQGMGNAVKKFLPHPLVEIPPGGRYSLEDLHLHALPSGPQPWFWTWPPRLHPPATDYLLQGNRQCVYFSGEGGYGPHFKETGKKFSIRVALLPLSLVPQGSARRGRQLSPEEFLQALQDLKARVAIPIHWNRSDPQAEAQLALLQQLARQHGLIERLAILTPGSDLHLP